MRKESEGKPPRYDEYLKMYMEIESYWRSGESS
jgi:hypothetical protein